MAEINCTNKVFTQGADAISLNGYSSLNDMDKLLYLATPTGYSDELGAYTFDTDEKGARTAASYLSEGVDAIVDAIDSIGFLLSVAESTAVDGPFRLRGIGGALMLMANTLQASVSGMVNLEDYANALAKQSAK